MRADLGGAQVIVGDVWSCDPCHADGLTDRLAWQIGPGTSHRKLSPALTLLEGTLAPRVAGQHQRPQQHGANCHAGPLLTSRARVERNVNDGPLADIASLIGTARRLAALGLASVARGSRRVDARIARHHPTL